MAIVMILILNFLILLIVILLQLDDQDFTLSSEMSPAVDRHGESWKGSVLSADKSYRLGRFIFQKKVIISLDSRLGLAMCSIMLTE